MSMQRAGEAVEVLLIEDDPAIGGHLRTGLLANGYEVRWCRTGEGGLAQARQSAPDVVLLDLGLPDTDGVDVARTLRGADPEVLIIILTARADEIDIIVGLDAGADDYLVKPATVTVLLARLRAHLRRRPAASAGTAPVRLGDLVLDVDARRCLLGGREISLRPKEFDLLAALARRPGVAVSRDDLMAEVWDEHWFGPTKTLDVTMAALRRRLGDGTGVTVPVITTLRGHGYRLETPL
ncbi:response regulator transcription factor [Amycolatopsis vastitatis]|uniref:DNA-binding response regulator n=1 Tax=Amycolatopsis vastitatis TaxID=1905142 RepID=A0A229SL98_9PSEU|nr:response regulator transcription factor [Amycolatopsis vastitatis]OXM59712.1 DNA-binding response regulator [Amycolatopsis vastitatis]